MNLDFGGTAEEYARYHPDFPPEYYRRLALRGVALPGHRVIDMGTGTGSIARALAIRGCDVWGVDPSEPLLREARRLGDEQGVRIRYVLGHAERTGLPGGFFDVVTAARCWQLLERPHAAAEARRLLVPGGILLIGHFDRVGPSPSGVLEATQALVERYNPGWGQNPAGPGGAAGLYPSWAVDVVDAGFLDVETFSFDICVAYSHDAWCGRTRSSAGVGAALPPELVEKVDIELRRLLSERFPEEPLIVRHRAFAVTCRAP
jgi:SAM-dependent methyltransferase